MQRDTERLPEEIVRAVLKHEKAEARIVKAEGAGASKGALALAQKHISKLTAGLTDILDGKNSDVVRELLPSIRALDPHVRALCILQGALHSITADEVLVPSTFKTIGEYLYGECWAHGLLKHVPATAAVILEGAKRKSSLEGRLAAAKADAKKIGYKTDNWELEHYLHAGEWAIDALLVILPEVFTINTQNERVSGRVSGRVSSFIVPQRRLLLTDEAQEFIEYVVVKIVQSNPVWLPVKTEPPRWIAFDKGGTADTRLFLNFIRDRRDAQNQSTAKAVGAAIKAGRMKPALDAVNSLQSVRWKINERVLAVLRARPPVQTQPFGKVEKTKLWEDMSDAEKRNWIRRRNIQRGLRSDYSLFVEDVCTAEEMAKQPHFYTPMNLDWRGRIYGVPSFNFQRDDRVRALFLFAEGKPITEEGLYWLKVHTASCGDFDKISKQPFDDRVAWVEDNREKIINAAKSPLDDEWWREGDADSRHLFLAGCVELCSAWEALDRGLKFETHLPIAFDGSCNGIQHQCAMIGGRRVFEQDQSNILTDFELVNLTPRPPQDLYEVVAQRVKQLVENDQGGNVPNESEFLEAIDFLGDDQTQRLAAQCLEHGITRKVVKRPAMTFGYGSNPGGMADQIREDTMDDLVKKVLQRKLSAHPFGEDDGEKASRYLAKHIYQAVQEVAKSSTDVKKYLRKLSNALSNANKPLCWTTPVGLPWINLYQERSEKQTGQVKLLVREFGVKKSVKTHLREYTATIDHGKAANGVAPNFVHACDAAHLMLTVNAAVSEGITSIATVHDSFGCLAPDAPRFREIIREQFVKMYEDHDVLQEVYEQACEDLKGTKQTVPLPPAKGTLNIKEVLQAEYAFA